MARFIYRMQNILSLKERLETQAENEYALSLAGLNEEERKLEELKERLADYEAKLRECYSGEISLLPIRETQEAIEIMKYRIEAQKINIINAEKKTDIARKKLEGAMQERKTQEKLKENAFEVFLEEVKAQENKEIDELVSYRFGAGKEE